MTLTNDLELIGIALAGTIGLVVVASLIVKKDDIESMLEKPISVRDRRRRRTTTNGGSGTKSRKIRIRSKGYSRKNS
jgi:hypothetical protein